MLRLRSLKSHRFLLATTLVAVAALIVAGAAYAAGANLSPDDQTVCSGCTATWHASWSGASPFGVSFDYGDHVHHYGPTSLSTTSKTFTQTWYTCYDEEFQQILSVTDANSQFAFATSVTHIQAGDIC